MPFQICMSLLVTRLQLNAPSIGIEGFLNPSHLVVNPSQLSMRLHTFAIYLIAFSQALEGVCVVSLTLVYGSQAMKRNLVCFIILDALCITDDCFLRPVQAVIQMPYIGNHTVILGFLIEVFEIILQGFFLVLATILRQSFVGLAELWVKFDDPS